MLKANEIYYSPITKVALYVYNITSHDKVSLNKDFNDHGKDYELSNFYIYGAKIFILYNCNTNRVFHAHLRLFKDDTEQMRYANKLTYQIRPYMSYDSKYAVGGLALLKGNIYSK